MGKGLGAIIVEVEVAKKEDKLRELKAPACPLCGNPMTATGGGWFCYGPSGQGKCPKMGILRETMYRVASEEYVAQGSHLNTFQGQTFAAVVKPGDPPQIIAEFASVRGGGGRTNLRIWTEGVEDEDVPRLIQEYGWTWYEWAKALAYDFDPYEEAAQTRSPDINDRRGISGGGICPPVG